MKINCDMGELGIAHDTQIMPFIHMASIACGFHASDPLTIKNTVKLARQHHVVLGAHPSYPDRENFGRLSMALPSEELKALLHYQIGALHSICNAEQVTLNYVKPHGALYNDMMKNLSLFETVCQAITELDMQLSLVVQALPNMTPYSHIAKKYQLPLIGEVFADRHYTNEGFLVARSEPNAVITEMVQLRQRMENIFTKKQIYSVNDTALSLSIDTLCVHSDSPNAIEMVKQINALASNAIS